MTNSNSSATPSTSNLYEHPWYTQLSLQDSFTTSESPLQPKPKQATLGRKCTKCQCDLTEDNITQFRLKTSSYICTPCNRDRQAELWNSLSDAEYLWRKARARAKAKGRAFTITIEDVEKLDTDVCPIFHIPIKRYPMVSNKSEGKYLIKRDSKSLDRIDSSKGYEPGNIRIISFRCNELLSNMTTEELRLISEYYASQI